MEESGLENKMHYSEVVRIKEQHGSELTRFRKTRAFDMLMKRTQLRIQSVIVAATHNWAKNVAQAKMMYLYNVNLPSSATFIPHRKLEDLAKSVEDAQCQIKERMTDLTPQLSTLQQECEIAQLGARNSVNDERVADLKANIAKLQTMLSLLNRGMEAPSTLDPWRS